MGGQDGQKVQTNLRLSSRRAASLDIQASIEGKDKSEIVDEALALREKLLGPEYERLLQAALQLRFSDDPAQRLQAIEELREEVAGATPGGSTSVSAAIAKLQARSLQPA